MSEAIDRNIWLRLLELESEFQRRGESFGKRVIAEVLKIGISTAERYAFALKYKHIIRCEPDKIDTEDGDVAIVIADPHIPYQDSAALEAAISWGEQFNPQIIVILGDLIDFYKISNYVKNPGYKSVSTEIKETRRFLENLRARFPLARIIYKKGNHEDRMDRYIMKQAHEIHDLVEGLLENKLGLADLNIEYHPDVFKIGKLWYLHGHEKMSGSYNPEHIVNVMMQYVYDHFIVAHFHRNQYKPYRRIDKSSFYGGAVGYLAGDMEYARLNKWQQGVAKIEYERSGRFQADIRYIENGEVY